MILMAAALPNGQNEDLVPEDPVRLTVAELLGRGKTRGQVARTLEHHLLTPNQRKYKPQRRRLLALRKIRRWQKQKEFRDLVWANAVERLDSRTPEILNGVGRRAETGRVDAAKLGLEIAGRYTPRGQDQPTSVHIVLGNVPRPVESVEGELISEEDVA
jgi:hypothetical protein